MGGTSQQARRRLRCGHNLIHIGRRQKEIVIARCEPTTLDKAPGLPAEMDTLLHDIQSLATDFSNLINAAAKKDQAAATAAETALQADAAKVEAFDFTKASTEIDAFYKPLIDDYNAEIDKANAG